MEEKAIERNEGMEIDIQRVFGAIWSKAWAIVLSAVAGAVAAFLITFF